MNSINKVGAGQSTTAPGSSRASDSSGALDDQVALACFLW